MSLKKTFLLMFLFLAPFFIVTPVGIATPSPTRVFLDPQSIRDTSLVPGTRFTVNLCLDYIEPDLLWAYQFNMSFNPEVLHGVSVENGPFLESGGGDALIVEAGFNNTKGKMLGGFAASLFPVAKFPSGGSDEYGPLATVTFEVVGYGSSPLTLGRPTGLANKTGGWIIHKKVNPEFFSDGYFDNRPPIFIDPAAVKDVPVGGSFTLNVSIADIVDLYSWEFHMNWSAPLLNVTSIVEGDFLSDGTEFYQELHNNEGYIYANCTRAGATGVTGSGTLAKVTFLVEDEGKSTLHLYDTLLLDSARSPMISTTIDGFFNNQRVHDIAVTSVTASPSETMAGSGEPVYVNVTVENKGAFTETFNVTIYYDEEEISSETDISLDSGANTTLMFTWDTTGVESGVYGIKAVANVVADAHTEDNTLTYRSVIIVSHDISIIVGTTSSFRANIGESVIIGVIVQNKGSMTETFNVTIHYNETAIETEIVTSLPYGQFYTVSITWNITDVKPGLYLIKAVASDVPDEIDTSDNVFNIGVIDVKGAYKGWLSLEAIAIIAIATVAVVASVTTIVYRTVRKPSREEWPELIRLCSGLH